MTAEMWVKVLMFSSGLVGLVSSFVAVLPQLDDVTKVVIGAAVSAVVGAIDLALFVFFQVKRPIERAFDAGADAQLAARPGQSVTYKSK